MKRASMSRWGLVVLGAAAMVSGCTCGSATVECTDVTVKFDSPKAGDQVTSPFDVNIRATDSNGVAYKFESATLEAGGSTLNGTVSDATAKFTGVSLPGGAQTLKATIVNGSCERSASIDITVKTETCTTPAVTAVSFPQDTSNDGVLTSAELPQGTSLQALVVAECVTGVQVQLKRGTTVVGGPAAFSNGQALVTMPTLPDADSATYDLVAELVQNGAPVGSPGAGSIRVERATPDCRNTTELVQGPRNGGMGAQHALLATGTTTGVSAEFRLDGMQAMQSTPSMGAVSATYLVPKTGETTYQVELRCTDQFGNVATNTRSVRVDYVPPTVTITQPATNPDGGATVVTDSPTRVRVMTNAEDGSQVCATRVQGMTRTLAGCDPVTGGVADIDVSIPLDGTYTIEVEVTDAAGNMSTGSVVVNATLSGCGLGFTRPGACPALITAAQVNNGVYSFQTQSNATCSGQTVSLTVTPVLMDGGVGMSSPIGSGAIGGNGQATIPGTVTSGEYIYTAQVTNPGADAGVSTAHCDVTVDLDGPAIQSPVVPTGQPYATINVAQDTQPGTAGAQRLLQFSARVPTDGRVDVCTTQAIDPATGIQRPTSTECGSGWYVMQSNVTSPANGFTFSEGQYSIKIVVIGGGTTSESAPVPVLVDVTRPCVRKVAAPWPQDANSDSRLNIAELGANAPRLQFQLDPACKDTDTSTLAATNPVVVRNIVSGGPTGAFNLAADATFAAGTFTVNLTQGVANEQDYRFFVELTDIAGNKNLYTGGMTDPARHDVRIDKVAPSCDILAPSASQTLLGLAQVPGGQFTVTVGTSADVPANGISVTLPGATPPTRTLTPMAPAYQASTVFSVTGTNSWTVSSTCTDVAGNSTPATNRTLTIDLDAPTCTMVSPTNASPYSVNQIQTTVNVTGAEGQMVQCTTSLPAPGTPLTPALVVASGVATHLLTYPNGTQTVACTVSDPAGNSCSTSVNDVVVNSTACGLTLTSPAMTVSGFWHNRTNTSNLTANTGTATITATTPDCGMGKTVTLQRMVPTMGTATTATTGASGAVSFANVALTDGERWEVRIDNGAGVLTTESFRVGLVAPAATGVTIGGAAVTSGSNLYFVAATGNRNVETATAGYFADTNASAAGAQFDVQVAGVTGARKGGVDGVVQLVFKGTVVDSQTVTTEPQTFSFVGTTLPHDDSGAYEVRVVDAAGNSTSVINNPTAIDVIAPGAPTVTQTLTNARAAQVTLQWAPTYDDGTTAASGAHAGYDVRWTTSSVPNNNSMATSTDYFGSSSYQDSLSAWSASNITRVLNLPPLNTYYYSVRAKDEVGNYSTHTAPNCGGNVGCLQNMWTEITLTGDTGSAFGQTVAANASLNNDSIADIVVAAPNRNSNVGSVFVYFGGAGFASQVGCSTGCQEIQPPGTANAGGQFGADLSTGGDIGNVGAEAKPDLVISQPGFATSQGRVVLYFGAASSTLTLTNFIEIRGDATNTRAGAMAQIIKDLNNDGLDEVLVSSHPYNSNQGRVYVFFGRSFAAWQAARTAMDASNIPYIPLSAADRIIEGPSPVLVVAGNAFSLARFGVTQLGDLDADGRADFTLPMSRDSINRLLLFSGATVASAMGPIPHTSVIQTLTRPVGTNAALTGFGTRAIGGQNVINGAGNDLVATHPQQSQLHIFADLTSSGATGGNPSFTITGANLFGAYASLGDLSGDGAKDVVVGEGNSTDNAGWVLYQRAGSFDATVGGSSVAFWVSVIRGGGSSALGRMNAASDVNGDGAVDLLLGDEVAASVRVWR